MQNQALIDLLRRWLRGETRGRDESRLERAAQEDPFLADAWEGFSQKPQADHLHQLKQLNAKIAARTQTDQRNTGPILIWLPRLAAAAAVLLLLTFGWKWLFNPTPKADLVVDVPSIESKAEAESQPTPSTPEVAVSIEKADKALPSKRNAKEDFTLGTLSTEELADDGVIKEDANGLADAEIAEEKPKVEPSREDAPGNAASSRAAGNAADKDQAKINPAPAARDLNALQVNPTVGGIVVDERGQRAAGIPVQHNANTFAITNREGAFELPSAAPAQVKVIDPEFETQSLRLDNNDEKVVLQRKTKAQKKSFETSDRREGVGYPSPEGGFEQFEQYIQKNIETPFEAKLNAISGDVTLEFTFEKDGKPARIRILRPLGFGCDQIAERLIEDGPKWRNGKPGTWVIYKVAFK
ncbi:MAG: energy transducer TonB [Haliscomenobacter sp.]|uniref:energy transducer TonB n=1 Tax=Haliscomenobacter sp. TaxID=2717303 RepID=UPI0029B6D903|nr:energy transducer TonB [Haliscomenobacter sp.]MDX2070512.1 energy transducer TonB [Haliscomenobacter sp.]